MTAPKPHNQPLLTDDDVGVAAVCAPDGVGSADEGAFESPPARSALALAVASALTGSTR